MGNRSIVYLLLIEHAGARPAPPPAVWVEDESCPERGKEAAYVFSFASSLLFDDAELGPTVGTERKGEDDFISRFQSAAWARVLPFSTVACRPGQREKGR